MLDEHAWGLRRFLVGYVGWAEADDCLQDTLLAALEAYPGLQHGSNLRGWLFTIARRKALDCLRRRARKEKLGLWQDRIGIETTENSDPARRRYFAPGGGGEVIHDIDASRFGVSLSSGGTEFLEAISHFGGCGRLMGV